MLKQILRNNFNESLPACWCDFDGGSFGYQSSVPWFSRILGVNFWRVFLLLLQLYKICIYYIYMYMYNRFDCDSWYIICMACFFKHIFTNKPLEILFHQQNCRCGHRGPGHLDRLRVSTDLQKLGTERNTGRYTPGVENMVHLKIPPWERRFRTWKPSWFQVPC